MQATQGKQIGRQQNTRPDPQINLKHNILQAMNLLNHLLSHSKPDDIV